MPEATLDDTYASGQPIEQIVFGLKDSMPTVRWRLPNGDRLHTTLLDYNRNFPFIFTHEAAWRNAVNLKARQRLGLTDVETGTLVAFEQETRHYFEQVKSGVSNPS